MSQCKVIADYWEDYFPLGTRTWVKESALHFGGVFAIALLAQIAIPLPYTPVPITGQTLGILIIGASYGRRRAMRVAAAYIFLGALGLPIFAKAASGLGVLVGPTSGYLLGFLIAAYVMGYVAESGWLESAKTSIPLFVVGHLCIFICGLAVLGIFVGYDHVLGAGLYPFLPGMVIKSLLAGIIVPAIQKFVQPAQKSKGAC